MSIDPFQSLRIRSAFRRSRQALPTNSRDRLIEPRAIDNRKGLLAHLSRWLVDEGLQADALQTTEVERFLLARRAAGYTRLLSIKPRRRSRLPARSRRGAHAAAALAQRSGGSGVGAIPTHLTVERGLGAKTASGYVDAVRLFLQSRLLADGLALDLSRPARPTSSPLWWVAVPVKAIARRI